MKYLTLLLLTLNIVFTYSVYAYSSDNREIIVRHSDLFGQIGENMQLSQENDDLLLKLITVK